MSTRYGRTIVSLPRPLPPKLRVELEEQGYEINEASNTAERYASGKCRAERPSSKGDPRLPHVYYIGVSANVGMLVYSHWARGDLVRHLLYSSDSGWTAVGTPEPWEREILGRAEE